MKNTENILFQIIFALIIPFLFIGLYNFTVNPASASTSTHDTIHLSK